MRYWATVLVLCVGLVTFAAIGQTLVGPQAHMADDTGESCSMNPASSPAPGSERNRPGKKAPLCERRVDKRSRAPRRNSGGGGFPWPQYVVSAGSRNVYG